MIKIHFPLSVAHYLHDSFPLPVNKFLLADFPILTRMKTVRYIELSKDSNITQQLKKGIQSS